MKHSLFACSPHNFDVCRCQDYIEIDAGAGGHREFCGSSYPKDPLLVGTGIQAAFVATS